MICILPNICTYILIFMCFLINIYLPNLLFLLTLFLCISNIMNGYEIENIDKEIKKKIYIYKFYNPNKNKREIRRTWYFKKD